MVICNGTRAGTLAAAAGGEARRHPLRRPGEARRRSFKLWLKYAKPARGQIVVDDGAARVLRESGSSLLPVGIVAVEGDFDAGDAVDGARRRQPIGKGITDYSARELSQVFGMKSARRARCACHTRPTRSSTAIASCCSRSPATLVPWL